MNIISGQYNQTTYMGKENQSRETQKNSRSKEKSTTNKTWKDGVVYEPSTSPVPADSKRVNSIKNHYNYEEPELSDKAKALLERLKSQYSNMDFFIASYSSEAEAQNYLRQGSREYSVLIDPETLEAMANDEELCKKYESILAGAGAKFEAAKESLGEDADKVVNFGISIDKDGNVSFFAQLDKLSEKRQERMEKASEKAKENAKKQTEWIHASSMEELVEKTKNYKTKNATEPEEPSHFETFI